MGRFSSARRRSRQSQAEHRHCLLQALAPVLSEHSDGPRITGAEQGLHLCLRLPNHINDQALAQRLAQQGLTVRPLSAYCLARQDLRGLVIGYGYAPLSDIARPGAGGGGAPGTVGATSRLNQAGGWRAPPRATSHRQTSVQGPMLRCINAQETFP